MDKPKIHSISLAAATPIFAWYGCRVV